MAAVIAHINSAVQKEASRMDLSTLEKEEDGSLQELFLVTETLGCAQTRILSDEVSSHAPFPYSTMAQFMLVA
jgi:hypothetical protein